MFGVDTSELLLIAVVALLFIGPKDLPAAMRTVGRWIGKARGMARHFNSGIEAMIRESELEEMEKKWREENDRIMRDFPAVDLQPEPTPEPHPTLPLEAPAAPSDDPAPPDKRKLP